jgi:preprotein translocase subunit YajC
MTGLLGGLMPFILIFGVFYFLIIVPQRRKQRALQDTIAQLKAGDRIVTTGGILATVTAVRDASLLIRSADKSILEISRSAVAGLQIDEQKEV